LKRPERLLQWDCELYPEMIVTEVEKERESDGNDAMKPTNTKKIPSAIVVRVLAHKPSSEFSTLR
jgi:hypothetical protein